MRIDDSLRDKVVDEMSKREYDYAPSLLERFGDWLGRQLDELVPDSVAAPGTFGGGVGSLVVWIIIALAVAAIVFVIVWVLRNRVGRAETLDEDLTDVELEHRKPADEWASEAEALERDGRWKEAIRARYRELVRTLVDRRQLPDVPGLTTGELRVDLSTTTPDVADAFDEASTLFELPWYADVETGPAEQDRFREAARSVLNS